MPPHCVIFEKIKGVISGRKQHCLFVFTVKHRKNVK